MKTERKNLINFPNLKETLLDLRKNKQLSYQKMAEFFNSTGYKCSSRLIRDLCQDVIGDVKRSRTGKNNSFYGKSHAQQTKELISSIRIQKQLSKGHKNPMYGKKGEQCPAWRGGFSSRQAVFYASKEWQEKRLEIMNRDNFECSLCHNSVSNKHGGLNVHHIMPISVFWEGRLENDNLITLCVLCHKQTFGKEKEFEILFQDIVRTHMRI